MSWTVPVTDGKGDAKKREQRKSPSSLTIIGISGFSLTLVNTCAVHKVLEEAVKRRVLMFCSAPDKGNFTTSDYPSGPWHNQRAFFLIGAASADGNAFLWTREEGTTYLLPGVDVIRGHLEKARSTPGIPNRIAEYTDTGSSVSTALAAGLAAMIIYCVKASVLRVQMVNGNQGSGSSLGTLTTDAPESIAHFDEMRRAFASLGTVTQNNFVQVWEELDKISESLETWRAPTSTAEAKEKAVRDFVSFGLKLWSAAHNKH
jgi:hypothetical protein